MTKDEIDLIWKKSIAEAHAELVDYHDRYQYEIEDLQRKKIVEKIIAIEREACAKALEEDDYWLASHMIRARGNSEEP